MYLGKNHFHLEEINGPYTSIATRCLFLFLPPIPNILHQNFLFLKKLCHATS